MQAIKQFFKTHPHAWWGAYLPVYLAMFFTIEHFITDNYWATQTVLDTYIPFCEWFIFPYVSWSPLLVVLGVYLVRQQAEKGGDSPFSGILPDSSANNSVGADEDTFTDEVTPSDGGLTFASGGTERQEPSDPADYVLTGHPELAQQARQWLSQQGLEPDEDGVYSLTSQQVQDLNAAVPELELPTDDALRLLLED